MIQNTSYLMRKGLKMHFSLLHSCQKCPFSIAKKWHFYSEFDSGCFDTCGSMIPRLVPRVSSCEAAGAGGIRHSRSWFPIEYDSLVLKNDVIQEEGNAPIWVPFRGSRFRGGPFLWIWVRSRSPFLSQGPLFLHFRLKNA